jgi:NAD(P)-dependent dehydrogenase (short-subunit alcohol dehydrogenase family)
VAKPPQLSKDGYELQFAVNHLAHALVIKLLFPALLEAASKPTPDARIVLLTSVGWRGHPKGGIQISKLNTVQDFSVFGSWQRYGQSKLANIIYAKELARRYPTITSVSVHPGVVKTDLVGDLGCADKLLVYATNLWQTVEKEEGALNQLWMAAGAKKGDIMNGAFYLPVGIESNATLDKNAQNVDLGKELWEWTESVLGKF